jgi:hypothetical protein
LWLIALDRVYLRLLEYSPIYLGVFLLTGGVVGFVAGLWVGWRLRSPRLAALRLGRMSAARRLLWSSCQGGVAGVVIVSLWSWFILLLNGGRYGIGYLVQVNVGGAVAGSLAVAPLPWLFGIARSEP